MFGTVSVGDARRDHVCISYCFDFVHVITVDDTVKAGVQIVQEVYHLMGGSVKAELVVK